MREESASVKKLQSTVQALEQDNGFLQERVQRLEKDLTAGPDINKPSGTLEVTKAAFTLQVFMLSSSDLLISDLVVFFYFIWSFTL